MAQFNTANNSYQSGNKTLFEVNQIATANGDLVTNTNPFPVTLGSENITITGNVNVGTTVSVNSTPEDPVHIHITEVGTSNALNVPYLPIGGNVVITSGNVAVSGSVNVGNFPPSQNVVVTSGSVNVSNFPATSNVNIFDSSGQAITSNNPLPITGDVVSTLDPVSLDAFGRQRVSTPLTLFDSSHRYRDNGLWVTSNTAGTTYAHNTNQGLIDLNLPTTANAEIVRETTKVFAYQPGKSLLVLSTFAPATPKANLRQRLGYFGTQNGIYFEIDGTTAYFVKRSYVTGAVVETRIAQADWNINILPALDISKAQFMWMDIEWLGIGTVRCGFVIDGKFIHCHSFHHANIVTSTYITTAMLPLRYEIKNTGTTASASTMKQVCSTVISEGGYELRGLQQAVNIPIQSPRTLGTAGTFYPVIGLRLKSTNLDAIAIVSALAIMPISTGAFNWQIRASGTITGGSWVSAGSDSSVEYNITGTSFTDGRPLASGFFAATNQGITQIDLPRDALFKFQMERNGLTSTPYQIILAVASNSSDDTLVASMDWEEISR